MTNLLHTGHLMPFKDQMCAGSDVAAYTRPRASEAALAAAAAAASSAELLSVSGLAEDSSYGAPAPADTTSELLLVENVLALGLDCPPFAVLAFIPISFHTKRKSPTTHTVPPRGPTIILVLVWSTVPAIPLPGARLQRARSSTAPLRRLQQQILLADKIRSLSLTH